MTKRNNQIINISLFYCSNSFSSEEIHHCSGKIEDVQLNTISLPCSGKVNLLYLLKAIETGSDGVVLLTCRIGECKYVQGNLRAKIRTEAIDDLLDEAGFGRGCIKYLHPAAEQKIETLVNEISSFKNHLKTVPQFIKKKA